ncbi:MAG TPA: hypothetical protein VG826_18165 [Pirellulales bacterium]|nr:hypothetical protein [Pirellulales bacterium]
MIPRREGGANRGPAYRYLIDKRGHVRYWWYGELNREGSRGESWRGEKYLRQRIEELLDETEG